MQIIMTSVVPLAIWSMLLCCGRINHHVHGAVLKTIASRDVTAASIMNEHLLVIFVSRECESCNQAERELSTLMTEMADEPMHVTIVRVVDSDIPKTYGITKEPAIVFYRYQNPLVYDEPIEAATIREWISYNQETALKILGDGDFEHLTQASSGATTGDWLVIFCDLQKELCLRFQHIYESVAVKLKGRINVAIVDTSRNLDLVQRFSITKPITIIFFRLGKMYVYSIDKMDVVSVTGFALGWYKNVESVAVPVQPTPFDALTLHIANMLKENGSTTWLIIVVACVAATAVCLALFGKKSAESAQQSKPRKTE